MQPGDLMIRYCCSFGLLIVPLSMLQPDGKVRLCKNMSDLKNALKKEIPSRATKAPDFVIINGCAVCTTMDHPWPTSGTLSSYVKGFLKYLLDKASQNLRTTLLWYLIGIMSIASNLLWEKQGMLANRLKGWNVTLNLDLDGPIHPKSIVLGNRENKKQL